MHSVFHPSTSGFLLRRVAQRGRLRRWRHPLRLCDTCARPASLRARPRPQAPPAPRNPQPRQRSAPAPPAPARGGAAPWRGLGAGAAPHCSPSPPRRGCPADGGTPPGWRTAPQLGRCPRPESRGPEPSCTLQQLAPASRQCTARSPAAQPRTLRSLVVLAFAVTGVAPRSSVRSVCRRGRGGGHVCSRERAAPRAPGRTGGHLRQSSL